MKHLTITCAGALCLLLAMPALAQTLPVATSTTASTTATTTVTTTKPEEVRKNFPRKTLAAAFQTRLTNLAANVSNRLDALYRRLDNVTNRLESRAGKMKAEGIDVTAAEASIALARTELAAAKTDLESIDATVAKFVGSTDPYENWKSLKTTYGGIRDHLKAAHKADVDALLKLQTATATPAPTPAATTTASTTSTNQ